MTHEEGLEKLVAVLRKHGLRKHTCINDWGYSEIEREIVSIFIPKMSHKLKGLWDSFKRSSYYEEGYSFEEFVNTYMFHNPGGSVTEVHKFLAETYGFPTCAEVRYAIQELKNEL